MGSALGSKWVSNENRNAISQLDEAKQVFRHFIARMVGYHLVNAHIGLVTFSYEQQIEIAKELSKVRRDFKTKLESARTKENTARWDAIETAGDMLVEFQENNPTTRLRIIIFTDGKDNCSVTCPAAVCKYLYDTNIVLDSLVIGTNEADELFSISKHTGGYAFNPQSRACYFSKPFFWSHSSTSQLGRKLSECQGLPSLYGISPSPKSQICKDFMIFLNAAHTSSSPAMSSPCVQLHDILLLGNPMHCSPAKWRVFFPPTGC
jgi:hypothetical protein